MGAIIARHQQHGPVGEVGEIGGDARFAGRRRRRLMQQPEAASEEAQPHYCSQCDQRAFHGDALTF